MLINCDTNIEKKILADLPASDLAEFLKKSHGKMFCEEIAKHLKVFEDEERTDYAKSYYKSRILVLADPKAITELSELIRRVRGFSPELAEEISLLLEDVI